MNNYKIDTKIEVKDANGNFLIGIRFFIYDKKIRKRVTPYFLSIRLANNDKIIDYFSGMKEENISTIYYFDKINNKSYRLFDINYEIEYINLKKLNKNCDLIIIKLETEEIIKFVSFKDKKIILPIENIKKIKNNFKLKEENKEKLLKRNIRNKFDYFKLKNSIKKLIEKDKEFKLDLDNNNF